MKPSIIQQKIFEIKGHRVMLDFDLAAVYEVETKVLNQGIKRNLDRFPEDFMFRLTTKEWKEITSLNNWSQNVTNLKSIEAVYLML
jgi:ORF6N domain